MNASCKSITALENQVRDLEEQIRAKEALFNEQQASADSNNTASMEVELEDKLKETKRVTRKLQQENGELQQLVNKLQHQLSEKEADIYSDGALPAYEQLIYDVEQDFHRQQQMESLLRKAKIEKDKAIRIIIKLLGKEKVHKFLVRSGGSAGGGSGSSDMLDMLKEEFLPSHAMNIKDIPVQAKGGAAIFGNPQPTYKKNSTNSKK